jgi:hypothetical protein
MSSLVVPGSSAQQAFRARGDRDTARSARLKIDGDAIQRLHTRSIEFAATFFSTGETVARSESRSRSAYYSVIARAVANLPNNNRETRLALYDRAEIALAAELLQNPQVSDEQVAVERLALERAIRKVECDAREKGQPTIGDGEKQRWSFPSFRSLFRVLRH